MTEPPPVWIISLAQATQRRSRVAGAFRAIDLPFEFIDAVDGTHLTDAQRGLYSHYRALFETGRGLGQGMFGCALSHLTAYRRMLAEGAPIVAIFEDDVVPTADLRSVLESIHLLPPDWQVVTLHSLFPSSEPEPISDRRIAGNHRVCTYRRVPFGTQGYLINTSGARRVLEVAYPVAFPPDELLFRRYPAGLVRYGIEPTVLAHEDVVSEIHRRPACLVPDRVLRRPAERSVVLAGKVWQRFRRVRSARRR